MIADLTGANANVMYELGLRHSLRKLTIQVADSSTPLPFDVKAVRTILIERSPLGLVEARKRLVLAIESGIEKGGDMVSATRVWEMLRSAPTGDVEVILGPVAEEEVDDLVEDEDGYIELVLGMTERFESVTQSLKSVAESIASMNEDTSNASHKLNLMPKDASPAQRLSAIREFADVLGNRAEELESRTSTYRSDLDDLDAQVTPLLRILATNPQLRNAQGTEDFLGTISVLAQSARTAFEGFGGFASSAKSLGAISSMLKAPSKSIVASISRLAETVTTIDDWDAAVGRITV